MIQCEGQISMFDVLNQQGKKLDEPPVLLKSGQKLYVVVRGDVREAWVCDEKSWSCGEHMQEVQYSYDMIPTITLVIKK